MFDELGHLLGLPPPNPVLMAGIVIWFVWRVLRLPRRRRPRPAPVYYVPPPPTPVEPPPADDDGVRGSIMTEHRTAQTLPQTVQGEPPRPRRKPGAVPPLRLMFYDTPTPEDWDPEGNQPPPGNWDPSW